MDFALTFFRLLFLMLQVTAPVWMFFILLIVALGQLAGRLEGWRSGAALYWSFITASTVGYGDIRPQSRGARVLAILIAMLGLILFGVIVAAAVQATTEAVRLHADLSLIQTVID